MKLLLTGHGVGIEKFLCNSVTVDYVSMSTSYIWDWAQSKKRSFLSLLRGFFNKNVTEFIIWYQTDDKVDLDLNRDHHIQTSILLCLSISPMSNTSCSLAHIRILIYIFGFPWQTNMYLDFINRFIFNGFKVHLDQYDIYKFQIDPFDKRRDHCLTYIVSLVAHKWKSGRAVDRFPNIFARWIHHNLSTSINGIPRG